MDTEQYEKINDGIIIRGQIYKLILHGKSENNLCNECDLQEVCRHGDTEYELCQDIHDKNHFESKMWYNYKKIKL